MKPRLRAMCDADIAAVHAVQCAAYPAAYHEHETALRSHLRLGPECCFVAEGPHGLLAYLFAHPWQGEPPTLHASIQAERQTADHLFIHDLAVLPGARGTGVAAALVHAVSALPRELALSQTRLIAVGTAAAFWARQGFAPLPDRVPAAYGEAVLMARLETAASNAIR